MKQAGHHETIDGYKCFIGEESGKKVIYSKQPIADYNQEITAAKELLSDIKKLSTIEFLEKHGGKY